MRLFSVVSAALILGIATAGAAQTRPVESPAPADATFPDLVTWLTSHPDHSAFPDELDRAIELAASVDDLRRVADEVMPMVTDQEVIASVDARLGRIALVLRDYATALTLYDHAYMASGGAALDALFGKAQALVQLGNFADADLAGRTVVAQSADYELKRRAYALVARVMHLTGRDADASRLLTTLSSLDDASLVEPDTLLLQADVAATSGSSDSDALERLAKLHPDSVALAATKGETVVRAPLPSELAGIPLNATPVSTAEPPQAQEAAPTSAPRISAIQVGSFSDEDNATHQVADLKKLGLDAHAERADRDGSTHFLVLLSVAGGSPQEASRVLGVLRDAGLDGFLVY